MAVSEQEAIRAYQRIHEINLEKRAMSKDQKEDREVVKAFLEKHPQGFKVWLTDARDKSHEYHIQVEDATRVVLLKEVLAKKLNVDKSEITPSFLAEAVEAGDLKVSDIQAYEDVTTHKKVKRTKVKRPLKKEEREAAAV